MTRDLLAIALFLAFVALFALFAVWALNGGAGG